MNLIEQLEIWQERGQYDAIIRALESMGEASRSPELTGLLARAYENAANGDEHLEYHKRALHLLESAPMEEDPNWNFRMGFALYWLEQWGQAIPYLERIFAQIPQDPQTLAFWADAGELLEKCRAHAGLVEKDGPGLQPYSQEALQALQDHIHTHFGLYTRLYHDQGTPGEPAVDLLLVAPTAEHDHYTLLTLGMGSYRMHVPEELRQYHLERAELLLTLPADWNFKVDDPIWTWPLEWLELLAKLPARENSWLGWGHTASNPSEGPFARNTQFTGSILLTPGSYAREAAVCQLPDGEEVNFYEVIPLYQEEMEYKCAHDAEALLQLFEEEPEEISLSPLDLNRTNVCAWRKKDYCIPPEDLQNLLPNWSGPQGCYVTDRVSVDGCPVGFCYRVEPQEEDQNWDSGWRFLAGDQREEDLQDRDQMSVFTLNAACNYAPEIIPLLRAPYGSAYRRDGQGVFQPLGDAPVMVVPLGEPLLSPKDLQVLESFQEGSSAYFGRMVQYLDDLIERGLEEHRFTQEQVHQDLDIALWYAYAWNNMDDYEHYYRTTQWMPASACNAKGCGAWYYRYACALLYCGRLEEARTYAEQGILEEPDYPWGYLEVAKLRCHFGDISGALEAVAHGLELVPGDYEFATLRQEILQGRSLEEMEYHFIDPGHDRDLQKGLSQEQRDKLRAVSGILCNRERLEEIKQIFTPSNWQADHPFCTGRVTVGERTLSLEFHMNEAALSKMDPARLQALWTRVREEFLQRWEQENRYDLYAVTVFWNGEVELLYRACESDLGLQVRLTREGNAGDGVPFLLENKEEQEEDPEAIPVPSLPEVLRFYRWQGTETQYGWCWLDRDHQALVEYTGTVGAVGQRRYIPWNGTPEQGRSLLEQAGTRLRERGYRPWAPQEEIWLVVQIPIPKVEFCGDMLFDVKGLQQQVEQLLAQSLDQLGLGYLDNQEFGPSSDISDAYVLNFYCVAVDRDRGTQGVCSALKELANAPQFKVAAMSPEEEDYALAYSSDGNRTFCL